MRLSEFWVLADDVFGSLRARSLTADLVIGELDDRTCAAALEQGVEPRRVWEALCESAGVPPAQRYGALDRRRRA